jgi:drug/metabolite transporter (DMT)-like permease
VSSRDPAAARFAVIQVLRLAGVALVVLGLVIVAGPSHRLSGLPDWVGFVLLIVGLADVFVVPTLLARRWRSPPE